MRHARRPRLRLTRLRRGPLVASLVALLGAVSGVAAVACSSSEVTSEPSSDGGSAWDAASVVALDGSAKSDGGAFAPSATCESYCKDVLAACTGDLAQYGSPEECIWFCARFPEGKLGDRDVDTLACRAYHAGTDAKTDPHTWCPAAGPFGGGVCGDRCGAFCGVAEAVCTGTGSGAYPWPSEPDCVTACNGFAYLDGGVDGGGEGAAHPSGGDTLNCRLQVLRAALRDETRCADLGPDSGTCR